VFHLAVFHQQVHGAQGGGDHHAHGHFFVGVVEVALAAAGLEVGAEVGGEGGAHAFGVADHGDEGAGPVGIGAGFVHEGAHGDAEAFGTAVDGFADGEDLFGEPFGAAPGNTYSLNPKAFPVHPCTHAAHEPLAPPPPALGRTPRDAQPATGDTQEEHRRSRSRARGLNQRRHARLQPIKVAIHLIRALLFAGIHPDVDEVGFRLWRQSQRAHYSGAFVRLRPAALIAWLGLAACFTVSQGLPGLADPAG
jgi:hypothetical protein